MTEVNISNNPPPLSAFLNTVCPGLPFLDDNLHFSLLDYVPKKNVDSIDNLTWPLKCSGPSSSVTAHIERTYLNVARPPFVHVAQENVESTTNVHLPLHVTGLFSKIVHEGTDQKQDGGKHIGANVNPLSHDPFRHVHLNPGCLTSMMDVQSGHGSCTAHVPDSRSPFSKMTSSINKFLRIGGADHADNFHFQPLINDVEVDQTSFIRNMNVKKPLPDTPIITSLIDFDQKHYFSVINASTTAKLQISANVNILNVFAIGYSQNYLSTDTVTSTSPLFPTTPNTCGASATSSSASMSSAQSHTAPYKRVVETPILRLQLNTKLTITKLLTISKGMLVVLGMSNGRILIINLFTLSYRYLDVLGTPEGSDNLGYSIQSHFVTSLEAIYHPNYELLIVAGFSSGEVVIIDPQGAPLPPDTSYKTKVVGKDTFVTYFKFFDLSPFSSKYQDSDDLSPQFLIGHFKLCHKPITCITSSLSLNGSHNGKHTPMVLALGSDDGLVRFIDLIATHDKNYGNTSDFYNSSIITDIVSNYFQDGVRDIAFSPDNNFFLICGKGDIIEVFRMTYYNVHGMLHKKTGASHRASRSRSGTINSSCSSNLHPQSSFLAPINTTSSNSMDVSRDVSSDIYFPPSIKDIEIVSRLKGHTNTVEKVKFVQKDQFFSDCNANVPGAYSLISCGCDGKVNFWEFNRKALPRLNKKHFRTSSKKPERPEEPNVSSSQQTALFNRGKKISTTPQIKSHARARSNNHPDELLHSISHINLGISNLLNLSSSTSHQQENTQEQLKIDLSLYRSLHEMRIKKQCSRSKFNFKEKLTCVVHPIINDKELPSIEVPLLTIDLSCATKNGQINGFHLEPTHFWIFGKGGDIFKYKIE